MIAATDRPTPCVATITFPVIDVAKAAGWETRARALGVRIDSAPTWRLGRVAFFVSLGTSTLFLSQAYNRPTNNSVIYPREADLKLIAALRECGVAGEIQAEEVAA